MAGLLDFPNGAAFGTGSPAETAQQPSLLSMVRGLFEALTPAPAPPENGNVLFKTASPLVNITDQDINRGMDVAMATSGGGLSTKGIRPYRASPQPLPMDEASRMARAREQGYTIDAYKGGQPYDWATMPEKNWRGEVIAGTENRLPKELTSINSPNADYAGFFSNQPAVANRFAEPFEHGAVWPTKLKFENPLVIDAQGKHAAAFQFDAIAKRDGTEEAMKQFRGAFAKDSPYDGVILKNTKDEGDVFVPRGPDQIRSRFAAFDPKKVGSGELLGSIAGMGILAPYMAKNK